MIASSRDLLKFAGQFPPERLEGEETGRYEAALGLFTAESGKFAPYASTSFGGGIYRLYGAGEVSHWTNAVEQVFPDYIGRVRCFGRDWLCNQFCLDQDRVRSRECLVLLFEIATGQVLKISETFEGFHEGLLVDDADAAVAEQLFSRWRQSNPEPLSTTQCVGYKVPLFLGGLDDLGNLERNESEVYWELTGQMLERYRGVPLGTQIERVKRE